jgi:hypothetical protein
MVPLCLLKLLAALFRSHSNFTFQVYRFYCLLLSTRYLYFQTKPFFMLPSSLSFIIIDPDGTAGPCGRVITDESRGDARPPRMASLRDLCPVLVGA